MTTTLPGRSAPGGARAARPPRPTSHPARVRQERTTRADRAASGKQLRNEMPLADHAESGRGERVDPVALLEGQAASRLPQLVPIRYGRMLATPFTFFRGAALIMAADLGSSPHTRLTVQLCGDAHLSNFGFYATPERNQAFDINDFDETYPGPFEWDVKRLAASVAVAGTVLGYAAKRTRKAVLSAVRGYREEMRRLAALGNLAVWYSHQDIGALLAEIRSELGRSAGGRVTAGLQKAQFRDSVDALRKLCVTVDGQTRIKSDPPLIVPGEEILTEWGEDVEQWYAQLAAVVTSYRRTLQSDRRHLLDQYAFVQIGFKVVGVGSVGTRAWVILLDGADAADPLFLQAKEAQRSVLAAYVRPATRYANQGERVVRGQLLTQMTSDIFLGWQRVHGLDGQQRDFYVRQLRDGKGSVTVENLTPAGMAFYARLCGQTLARAHARSGDRIAIAAYLGSSDRFDRAVAEYAASYASTTERDHAALRAAADDGRITILEGI